MGGGGDERKIIIILYPHLFLQTFHFVTFSLIIRIADIRIHFPYSTRHSYFLFPGEFPADRQALAARDECF